ncbi:MAG: glycosyltransferase family 4 protein [Pseudanabaenaceae cyanobacterium SKYGB_i_bin29]|nr:glycosyltransferase family 4 protein [Pseudanabaenaceae cyanobacterium SKYG29]MDW8420407.1 glycosyltransferase family 4 protein [Pseudanabaenaceae cyanobacterium SKYGB_i_bin29]
MRILVLAWEFPPRIVGGIARHVAGLFPAVVQRGQTVHLLTVATANTPSYEVVKGIHVHRLPIPEQRDFFQWVKGMNQVMVEWGHKLINEQPFDLLHAHDWLVGEAAVQLAAQTGLPLVATIHATEYGRHNGIHNDSQRYVSDQERRLASAACRVIVCSQYMLREVGWALGCPPHKVDVIYNGINPEQAYVPPFDREEWRAQFAPPDTKIIYYNGRLSHEKGIFVLLNAMPRVLQGMAGKVRCLIVGAGHPGHELFLKRQAEQLGIKDKVIFTGFMADEDLPKLRSVADCAVFPSLYEPFGIVALESFAAGVPVVVSNTGGLPEVVEDGVTGIVTKVNNSQSLAEGILRVLQDADLAQTLVANARAVLDVKFNWHMLAQQTIETYQKCLS